MLILHNACEALINSLIFDEGYFFYFEKMAIFEIFGMHGHFNFYPIDQEITVFGIKNALGKCLYFISKAMDPKSAVKTANFNFKKSNVHSLL